MVIPGQEFKPKASFDVMHNVQLSLRFNFALSAGVP